MSRKAAKLHIRKRSFLLIELLVSLALITLCLLPLIHPHVGMYKSELKALEAVQLERLAQKAFCEIKAILYEHKIHSWDQLKNDTAKGAVEKEFPLYLHSAEEPRQYGCNYALHPLDFSTKNGSTKKALLLQVELTLSYNSSEHTFFRTLFIERRETA